MKLATTIAAAFLATSAVAGDAPWESFNATGLGSEVDITTITPATSLFAPYWDSPVAFLESIDSIDLYDSYHAGVINDFEAAEMLLERLSPVDVYNLNYQLINMGSDTSFDFILDANQ